jgi:deazaflavin-dependent oxidoreductase (nitroreductase family)
MWREYADQSARTRNPARQLKGANMSLQDERNRPVIEEFRSHGGKVGGPFENMPLLLLHTTGAKSGQPRLNPVAYSADGKRFVIVASKGGGPTNPDWYYNLLAHPLVEVELGSGRFPARASVAGEPERSRLYARHAAAMPAFAEYRRRTKRLIPVVLLERT